MIEYLEDVCLNDSDAICELIKLLCLKCANLNLVNYNSTDDVIITFSIRFVIINHMKFNEDAMRSQ